MADGKKSRKKIKTGEQPESGPETMPENRTDRTIRIAAVLIAAVAVGIVILFASGLLNPLFSAPGSSSLTVYYFYGTECPHCENVMPVIKSLQKKYPDVDFQILEVWHDKTNNARYQLMNHQLNVQQVMVPEVIVGDVVLMGDVDIPARLESVILSQRGNLTRSS